MANFDPNVVRSHFIVGLRDAHAVENQALALINRQLDRLKNYDDVAEALRRHHAETEQQIQRLESILGEFGESHSALKDAALTMTGNLAALGHTIAGDEILKNTFANFAFENFEIASYRSLITMAEAGGFIKAIDPLTQTLEEELAMAAWFEARVPEITTKFLGLSATGQKADR